ncbi:MAG TPA: heavy metal-binding domain-containing protein [Pedobacter sp.]|jgi:uncharacterized protein YbjQ (UPF0145 family)
MTNNTDCLNCGTKIKQGAFSSNEALTENQTRVVNEYSTDKKEGYCRKCGGTRFDASLKQLLDDIKQTNDALQLIISDVPVITTHTPLKWDYDILGMATGQSTTGTGVVSEFTSSFTDLLGLQSNRYNAKLKEGEKLCITQIRTQAIEMGGNAIIATDIDYSELGGGKGMIMVCMSGTVVNLKNLEVIGEMGRKIHQIPEVYNKLKRLHSLNVFTQL